VFHKAMIVRRINESAGFPAVKEIVFLEGNDRETPAIEDRRGQRTS
jgi:hypothetical protein